MSKQEEIRKRATERMIYDAKSPGWSDTSELTNDVFFLLGETDRLRKEKEQLCTEMMAMEQTHAKTFAEIRVVKKEYKELLHAIDKLTEFNQRVVDEKDRLRKELEEAKAALHKIADGEWEESMDDSLNDVYTTRTINPEQIAHETLALLGQEGEGNQ